MSAALYVGRVGALAVALGIGVAIAGVSGLAWAGPEPGSDPADSSGTSQGPSTDPGDSPGDTGDTGDKDLDGGGDSADAGDPGKVDDSDGSADGMKVDSSGGALTSTHGNAGAKSNKDRVADPPKRQSTITPRNLSGPAAAPKIAAQTVDQPVRKAQVRLAPSGVAPSKAPAAPQLKQSSTPVVDVTPPTRKPVISSPITATMSAAPKPSATTGVSRLLSLVTLSAPTAGDTKPVSTDSPLFAAFFAAGRQVSQKDSVEDESTARTVDSTGTSLMMAAAAAPNSAPTASPTMGKPDQTTGQIIGNVNATDVDGNPLTYTVPPSGAGAPTRGTVSVNQTTGAFTYKPTAAARTAAGISAGADFDTFTVTVSDGQGGVTPVTVQLAVLPGVFENSNTPGSTQANPSGVAIIGNRAYVANQGTNTVSVLDATTGAAVGSPIVVGSAPTGVAASPDGSKVYVTNRTSGSVSVIRTSDNKVVNTITVGTQPESVTFSTDGTRAYVTNYGSKSVSVIDTTLATPKVITTISNVGTNPRGIAYVQTANGPRVYVANSGAGTVSVINASTNQLIDTKPSTALTVDPISVGSAPQQIAVSPDGTRIYVTNQSSNSVSVINTATNALDGAAIAVGSKPAGIALSADGSTLYVANGDDSVSVVDTKTRSVFGVMTLDNAPENNLHAVAVRGDGSLLVTDLADRSVRIVNYKRGNTAPVATGSPTVGTPSLGNGAVIGNANITDWDGDPLTYTTVTAPTKGSVSFDPASGTYTYTPTQAARDAAVQTPGLTDTFSVRATDPYGAYVSTASITVPILSSATNHAPTAPGYQYFDPTDSVTGEVRGRIIASDPDGNPLSYQVISGPWSASSFTFNSATGEFSYIPSQEKREYVTQWPGYDDYDYFQVVVSDGTASVSTSVSVLVSPIQMAPTAYYPPEVGSADPTTGRVSGSMNVYDPNGDTVAYAISSGPSRGTATVNAATGIYTYTPSSSERSVGGLDSFTVTATDGHDTSTFTVTVPVRAPELASSQTQIPLPGSGPNIALSGSRAYVFNKYLWTVSSIDTNTNTVIRTSQPLASGSTLSYPGNVAVSPDGTRVYVANWVEGKIIQLDPNTLAPVGQPIAVAGGGDDMLFSPDGTRLYVANDGAPGSLTVIDTNSRSVVGTIPTTYDTTDMVISSDGRTIYLADGYYNRIQVIDTNTKSVVGYIPLGPRSANSNPAGLALSPDGRWAYVTDPDNATVSVIDLTTRTVAGDPIVVGLPRWMASTVSWPTAIAVSPDGSRIYVANGDDIVVIDAATRKVVGAVRFPGYMSDSSARGSQSLSVDSNGDLLIYGGSGLVSVTLGASGAQMT